MPGLFLWIALGSLAAAAGAVYLNRRAERLRTEAMRQVAGEFGFDFLPAGEIGLLSELGHFHLFDQGHSKRVTNLMRGATRELEVTVFDYRFITGSGKNRTTWTQTVLCFTHAHTDLPAFCLRPENFWHKIGAWFGYGDINFESHPTFSKRFHLKGADEEAIRKLFDNEVLNYFDGKAGLSVEGAADRLLFYRASKRVKPEKVREFMEEGFEILALFRRAAAGT
ncbi:MAG TPA: hypothetical protein VIL46_06555 [Gemmataceae bacterium]